MLLLTWLNKTKKYFKATKSRNEIQSSPSYQGEGRNLAKCGQIKQKIFAWHDSTRIRRKD